MKTHFRLYLAGLLCLVLLPTTSLAHAFHWFDEHEDPRYEDRYNDEDEHEDDEDSWYPWYDDEDEYEDDDWDDEDWYEDCEEDEDCEYEEIDFATERPEIIADIREEITELASEEDQVKLNELLTKLEAATEEEAFFTVLDEIDEILEPYWDEDDHEDFEMTQEDCQTGELFDARYNMCFLPCETIEECEALEALF